MTNYSPDTFSETAFVCLSTKGGTEHEFMTITETVDIKVGDKDIDVINTLAGGRLVKFNPQDVSEITLEAYAPEVVTTSSTAGAAGTGFSDLMYTNSDSTQPISVVNDRTRLKARCVILWTNDTAATKATGATAASTAGFRLTFTGGYVTSYNEAFTDGVKKATIKMRVPAFDKSGTANITYESTDGNGVLPAITAYS
jgi:hypothetical protein